jgi:uridine kinase
VRLRRATAADARGIAELIAAVAEEGLWLSTRAPVDVEARAERLQRRLATGSVVSFVAVRDAQVAGELSLFVGPAGVMIGMCLARDVRGRGLGGALLDAAIAHASVAGWPLLLLDVYAHNEAARRLYASRGFVSVGAIDRDDRGDGRVFETITMERLTAGPIRRALIAHVADAIVARGDVRFVAIDGTDGAGKTCFATELAHELRRRDRPVIRASVDGFHHPRAVRYRRGRDSPLGFYEDSYDYAALERELLAPLRRGGSGWYRPAVHDVDTDVTLERDEDEAPPDATLVLDGIFLHRDELRDTWDYSVFLDVRFAVSIPRGAARDGDDPDPASASNRRYVEGQRIYFARANPQAYAAIVIDNTDLANPRILRE